MKTFLLVDDDVDFLDLFAGTLEYMFNVRVITCADSLKVPEILHSERVDLVITDTNMPGYNGIDLLKSLRRSRPDLPVVVLFSFLEGSSMTADEVMSLGAFAVVSKPEVMSLIADIIENLPA